MRLLRSRDANCRSESEMSDVDIALSRSYNNNSYGVRSRGTGTDIAMGMCWYTPYTVVETYVMRG